jgi:hypothetical protein
MYIPRLLALTLLISVWVAPVAAQSSADKSPAPRSFPVLSRNGQASIRNDQFQPPSRLDGINLPDIIPPPEVRAHDLGPPQSDVTCYFMLSYHVTRDDRESDSTRPADYSTCQPTTRFQVKDAEGSLAHGTIYQP